MRKPKRMLIVRDFRANFQRLTEPVIVIRSRGDVRILGTWYPEPDTTSTPVRYAADEPHTAIPERAGD